MMSGEECFHLFFFAGVIGSTGGTSEEEILPFAELMKDPISCWDESACTFFFAIAARLPSLKLFRDGS